MTTTPTRSGHLPINGLDLYYEVYGEIGGSTPLLLIPGAFISEKMFDPNTIDETAARLPRSA